VSVGLINHNSYCFCTEMVMVMVMVITLCAVPFKSGEWIKLCYN